jgi:hypothetical protein
VAKTIDGDAAMGEGELLAYTKTPASRLKNSVLAYYKENYHTGSFVKTYEKVDVASGYDTKEETIYWAWLRGINSATDGTDQYVRERRLPLKRINFPISYEHLDLIPSDTITVTADVWGGSGKKFWVEKVSRPEPNKGTLTLLEWY